MEENKEEKTVVRRNNKLVLIIMSVGVLLIGIGITLMITNPKESSSGSNKEENNNVNDNNNNNNNNNNNTEIEPSGPDINDKNDGEIDLGTEEVHKYFEMFKYIYLNDDALLDDLNGPDDSKKADFASRLVTEIDLEEVPCNSIDSTIIEREDSYCGGVFQKSNWINSTNTTKAIRKETIERYVKRYFGENKEYNFNSFSVKSLNNNNVFYYDLNLGYFVEIDYANGEVGPLMTETLEKASKKGKDLILTSVLTFEDTSISTRRIIVTLTLEYEELTNNYVFKDRRTEISDEVIEPDEIIIDEEEMITE